MVESLAWVASRVLIDFVVRLSGWKIEWSRGNSCKKGSTLVDTKVSRESKAYKLFKVSKATRASKATRESKASRLFNVSNLGR